MAGFAAALRAAREGHIISLPDYYGLVNRFKWDHGVLRNCERSDNCCVTESVVDGNWTVEDIPPPPPREYTFMEAVGMMEKNKRMRNTNWRDRYFLFLIDGAFRQYADGCDHHYCPSLAEIKGKWIEVE